MAIVKVRVQVDGVWTNLTLSNGKWVGTITAPATTSYNLSNKYYPIKIEITNDAGTVVAKDATDATLGDYNIPSNNRELQLQCIMGIQ